MNDHDTISNPSRNRPFGEVLNAYTSRRRVLGGGLALAATTVLASAGDAGAVGFFNGNNKGPLLNFEPTLNNGGAVPMISPDYEYSVILPWGDPIEPGGPAFSYPVSSTDQEKQIGIGHDGIWFFPFKDKGRFGDFGKGSSKHRLLCFNCEFGDNSFMFNRDLGADNDAVPPLSLEEVRLAQHAHGVTIVEIKKKNGIWQTQSSKYARRIHVNTPVRFSGPVKGHAMLQTPAGNEPKGTVNNCAMGVTPWGTYLTCEENFNGYFGSNGALAPTEAQDRYGFSETGFDYGWHLFDPRFDLNNADYKNEENRFGWVMEIDPFKPHRKPVKRTALGRFKHEGAASVEGQGGRVVVYMGDDERFDYLYKFVSSHNWKSLRARGKSPLDHGKLFVAKFNDDGTGEWLEMTIEAPALSAKFADQAEVLTYARLAADELGATPMDRPEWTTIGPKGEVFFTLTNNTNRGVGTNRGPDAANPQAPNPFGHIIKFRDSHHHVGTTFDWEIFVLAGDTHGNDTYEFSSPDGLWADPDGRLFIETDGGQPQGQDQLVIADTKTGEFRRLFAGVDGDEITGIAVTPDRKTLFINSQHPRVMLPGIAGPVPRDATIVITRKDGGVVGS